MGTSIQLGEGDGMYRMHIHVPAQNFYTPVKYIEGLGTLTRGTVENLVDQMESQNQVKSTKIELKPLETGQVGVIAVSPGAGLSQIFASLEVAALVEGGQTMNPSTEEILQAVENLPTDEVIILPNNKNIILAANNVVGMTKKKVIIIPSVSIPQGFNAMIHYDPDGDLEEVANNMRNALADVDTGEITVATRSVEINGVEVHEGEVIALLNGKLICSTSSIESACMELLEKADTMDKERITLFYGANITNAEVDRIVEIIRLKYPKHEIEEHEGGQPYYPFILAIE
jgi:uncharacterized protein